MTATVLVLAESGDATADLVAASLRRRGASVSRFDTADFPQRLKLASSSDSARLSQDGRCVELTAISAVYRRSPAFFDLPEGMSEPERRFAAAEAVQGLGGVLAKLDCRWVNHPSRTADASYKAVQLAVATDVGLCVPRTLITNDGDEAAEFAAEVGEVIYKPMSLGVITEDNRVKVINATRITSGDLDSAGIGRTACMFQQWVPKKFDVRLTAVGRHCFAVAIHTDNDAAHVDWRADTDSLVHEPIRTPDEVRDPVAAYLARFGLLFGAFDFSVTADGAWWFLECNPNGQWGWIQEATGLPIADALADLLIGDAT